MRKRFMRELRATVQVGERPMMTRAEQAHIMKRIDELRACPEQSARATDRWLPNQYDVVAVPAEEGEDGGAVPQEEAGEQSAPKQKLALFRRGSQFRYCAFEVVEKKGMPWN